jgi:DNA-binding LacI/PurR family transcriptional regulator
VTDPGKKNPTMRDVAERVGVSVQTVSAVINDKQGITVETRNRVLVAIDELGYRPFSVARSLRTRRTNTIALVVPDIANPSFSTIASAAEDTAQAAGYSLVNYNTHESLEREAKYIRLAVQRWVDGILFVSSQDQLTAWESLKASGIPCVAIDRIPVGYDGSSVTLDNLKAGELAANHLIELGHRRLAHISGPVQLRLARERLQGFQKALASQPVAQTTIIHSTGWNCEDGYTAMNELLQHENLPTALFAASDRLAIGAMHAAYKAGLRIPQDLSIIGLDDIEVAAFQYPPLTTVRQSFSEMARRAVNLLLLMLDNEMLQPKQHVLEPELIARASAAALD